MLNNQSYNRPLDYRYIKFVRLCRNLNQKQMADKMGIHVSDLSKLERNQLTFTPHCERKLRAVIRRLSISRAEIDHIKALLEAKERRGYK